MHSRADNLTQPHNRCTVAPTEAAYTGRDHVTVPTANSIHREKLRGRA